VKLKVFISSSNDTKEQAEILSREIERHGISTWLDSRNLIPGQKWKVEVNRALADCQVYLILVGPGSRLGPYQGLEWQGALEKVWSDPEKKLIPVLFGEAEPPAFLRDWVPVRVEGDLPDSPSFARLLSRFESPAAADEAVEWTEEEDDTRRMRFQQLEDAARSLKLEDRF